MPENKMLIDTDLIINKLKISEGMRVADLGCGLHGHFIFPIAQLVGNSGAVYAVDILKVVLDNIQKQARVKNIKNIKTIWTNLETFGAAKIESNTIDIVLLINTLYQSGKRSEIIREATRLLKTDGKLFVADWKDVSCGPPKECKVDLNLLKSTIKTAGFRSKEEFDLGPYHFGMIYIKN